MALIVNENLAAFTVKYNGVQFGGADATYKSLPPMYSFSGAERWDGAGRAVMWMDYTLTIRCIFFETSETAMGSNMAFIRQKLQVPGALLTITGLGSGFGTIAVAGTYVDVANGPKPGRVECTPIGNLSWELSWSVAFSISETASPSTDALAFAAFNFNTTWQNDFEGLTQRTISGHIVIGQARNYTAPKTVLHVAEETRGSIVVDIPDNFARVTNSWRESDDKSRLDFTIVDEQLPGDVLPEGITAGDGSFSFVAGDGKGAFANGIASLSMSLKTAPDQPRNLAGQIFFAAALSKQTAMQQSFTNQAVTSATVIPIRLSIVNGKFARARQTDCSIAWQMTSCLNAMLTAAGIWSPVGDNDYSSWKASMASLWGNRGFSGIESSASEAVIIDLGDNVTSKTIGVTGSSPNSPSDASLPSLTCPTVSTDGGWITWDLRIRVLRKDGQTSHRRAAAYLPTAGEILSQPDPGQGTTIQLGGPGYSQAPSDQHVTEFHGFPETYVGLTFKGLRYKNKPFTPEISTVAGIATILDRQDPGDPYWAFDVFGCPVWAVSGWRIYRIPGYVPTVTAMGSKSACGATSTPNAI